MMQLLNIYRSAMHQFLSNSTEQMSALSVRVQLFFLHRRVFFARLFSGMHVGGLAVSRETKVNVGYDVFLMYTRIYTRTVSRLNISIRESV